MCLGWAEDAAPRAGFTSRAEKCSGLITDDSEAHVLVIAPAGAGKGRNFMIPNLLRSAATAIVLDIKGEAARVTARERERMGHRVVIIDPFKVVTETGDTLNPLDCVSQELEAIDDDALMLASLLSEGKRGTKEPFWDDNAEDLAAGLIAYVASRKDNRNMGAVMSILSETDVSYALAVLLDTEKPLNSFARGRFVQFLDHEGDKVRCSVLSTARQHLRIFSSATVLKAVERTSFSLEDLRDGRSLTIYLVIPPNKLSSHGVVLRFWLATLMAVITQRRQPPETPTLMIVDEMAHIGGMRAFRDAVTLMRGYGLRCCLMLQSYRQLRAAFPDDHEAIAENCGTILTFGHTSMGMSVPMAEMLGDISGEALFRMTGEQLAIRRRGERTQIARRLDYLKDPIFHGRYEANPYYAPAEAAVDLGVARKAGQTSKSRR